MLDSAVNSTGERRAMGLADWSGHGFIIFQKSTKAGQRKKYLHNSWLACYVHFYVEDMNFNNHAKINSHLFLFLLDLALVHFRFSHTGEEDLDVWNFNF